MEIKIESRHSRLRARHGPSTKPALRLRRPLPDWDAEYNDTKNPTHRPGWSQVYSKDR